MEVNEVGRIRETDVLVLGGGAAGCMAAIGAREQGAKATIVDKGVIESCGAAGAGNDHYSAHLNTGPEWDTDDAMTKHVSSFGRGALYLNSRVIDKTFTKVVGPMIKRLEDVGIEFFEDPDTGEYMRTRAMGSPGPSSLMIKNGKYLKRKLAVKVRRAGAEVVGKVMVTRILLDRGKVAGAVGFNIRDGEFNVFRAKKVVLACGCTLARPWSNNSTGKAFNAWKYPYNTGSHQVMAYEAGAKIVGLEAGSATILPKGFGSAGMNALIGMGGYMLNALGERYMNRYHHMAEAAPRRLLVLGTYQEQVDGRGPPFYMDVRHLSEKDLEHLTKNLLPVDKDTYTEYLQQARVNLQEEPLEVEVGELGGGGTLLINERCESTVSGLYGSGVGLMLSGALCGGLVAGSEAGGDALKVRDLPKIDIEQVVREKERLFAPLGRDSGYTPNEFEGMIQQVMNYYVGYVRNRQGLETALKKLARIEEHIDEVKASNYHELLRANEARHLLKFCQLTVRAVLETEGSRGYYKRSDQPDLGEEMTKHIAVWQEEGELRISFEPVDRGG